MYGDVFLVQYFMYLFSTFLFITEIDSFEVQLHVQ